MKTKRKRF